MPSLLGQCRKVFLGNELIVAVVIVGDLLQDLLACLIKEADGVDGDLAADVQALDEVNDGLVEFAVREEIDEIGLAGEGPLEGLRRVGLALRDDAVDELKRQLLIAVGGTDKPPRRHLDRRTRRIEDYVELVLLAQVAD